MIKLLKNWPEPGCVYRGWTKTPEGFPPSDNGKRRFHSSSLWCLGNPVRFYVRICDSFGVETGHAESFAKVWYKKPEAGFKEVAEIELNDPDDLLGVVDALQKKYRESSSEEAIEWKKSMADFDKELKTAGIADATDEVIEDPDETPEFLEAVVDDWRHTIVDDNTSDGLLEAFIRFERSWTAYASCVLLNMVGDIYSEELTRSDGVGMLIDRKLHQTKDVRRQTWLMNLFRLMMPCYIGTYEEIEKSNVEYERKWCKWVAEDIVKEDGPLDYPAASLLIRVREDNKRLPAPVSKFIKNRIPKYFEDELNRLDRAGDMTIDKLKDEIRLLDNRLQWHIQTDKVTKEMALDADAHMEMISLYMETEDDLEAMTLYSNLLTTGFAAKGTIRDREKFYKRVEDRLKLIVRTPATRPSLTKTGSAEAIAALTEEFTLAAIYMENLFLEKEGVDIYTSYWQMHQRNIEEERAEREGGIFWW